MHCQETAGGGVGSCPSGTLGEQTADTRSDVTSFLSRGMSYTVVACLVFWRSVLKESKMFRCSRKRRGSSWRAARPNSGPCSLRRGGETRDIVLELARDGQDIPHVCECGPL